MRATAAGFFFAICLLSNLPLACADGHHDRRRYIVPSSASGSGFPVIKLGRTVSLSGVYQQESLAVFNGIRFWWEYLRTTTGGVINTTAGPHAIELIEYNDASDPENVAIHYRDMALFDNVTAAFGPWTTQLSTPAIQQTALYDIPFVFSGASAPPFYNSGYTHSFGLLVRSGKRSQPCMDLFAKELGVHSAVIIASTDSFQQTVLGLLASQAAALNITVRFNVTVDKSGTEDFTALADRIVAESPDALLCAMETPNFQPFIQVLRERAPDGDPKAVYNSNSATVSIVYANLGWPTDLVFGGDQWSPLLPFDDPIFNTTIRFSNAYEARFNYTPGFVDAASVMAGFAMQYALQNAASFKSADVIAALRTFTMPTSFFGPIAFLSTGELNATGICTQLLPTPLGAIQKATKARLLYPVAPVNVRVANATYPALPIRPPEPKLTSKQVNLIIGLSVLGGVLLLGSLLALGWFAFRRKFEVVFFPRTKGEDRW